jgi:hypothetical protein
MPDGQITATVSHTLSERQALHKSKGTIVSIQLLKGECLYTAMGKEGFRIVYAANADSRNFPEKMSIVAAIAVTNRRPG